MKTAYRRSIWKTNEQYQPPVGPAVEMDLSLIAKLQSIEAAKKRTPPVPIAQLSALAKNLKSRPPVSSLSARAFADYLSSLLVYGAGIKTVVCMLAVVSEGEFPPMDEKLAAGLVKLKQITPQKAKSLNRGNIVAFAKTYVEDVLPSWRKARDAGETPQQIDERWAQGKAKQRI